MEISWTGERYVPWTGGRAIHYEHWQRYAFATLFASGKTVLDLACGEGYGSYTLAAKAGQVVGMDVDPAAIAHAQRYYSKANLSFLAGSVLAVPLAGEAIFDVIVCFEAIEHVDEQEQLLKEVKRLLKKDGVFIVSSPNKSLHADVQPIKNPFHKRELYGEELRRLISGYFPQVSFFGQRAVVGASIWPLNEPAHAVKKDYVDCRDGVFRLAGGDALEPMFFVAVASSRKPDAAIEHFLLDVDNDMDTVKDLKLEIAELKASTSWRITAWLRWLKNVFCAKKNTKPPGEPGESMRESP
ncbi:MAG: class I SAM-dependent methyltransferase [Candidatus Omnitrophica bacterium]|nr:class I SAM-dependent methyltransferase [Candidatus Omnitrophota bacterium]